MSYYRLAVTVLLSVILQCDSLNCVVGSNYQVPVTSIDSGPLISQTCSNDTTYCVRLEGTGTVDLYASNPNTAG